MSPFLIICSFLTFLGLIASSEISQFHDSSIAKYFYLNALKIETKTDSLSAIGLLDDFRNLPNPVKQDNSNKTHPDMREGHITNTTNANTSRRVVNLKINEERPPNNARFNMYLLLNENQERHWYEICARLLRILYSTEDFFYHDLEYHLLDALKEMKDETELFTFPDDLLSLQFQDPNLTEIFHHMLLGGTKVKPTHALLNYITFDNAADLTSGQKKINLLFASEELLQAALGNLNVFDNFIGFRNKLREQIFQKDSSIELKRKSLSKLLKTQFEQICIQAGLPQEQYNKLFDYTLGRQGTIIFTKNPETGVVVRKKYARRHKIKN